MQYAAIGGTGENPTDDPGWFFVIKERPGEPRFGLDIDKRNVLDGLKLVEHVRKTGNKTCPFGKTLPTATAAQQAAINAEVDRLLDSHDAVADVAVAESVHQAAMGNYDRAAGTLDTYSKGSFPPIPDVIQTPRSGITLTQRVGLHLPVGTDPAISPVAGMAVTPRSQAEPNLNHWLASVLPAPADVACQVSITDPITETVSHVTVTQQDLGLQPLDLLYLLNTTPQAAMTELDERVLRRVIAVASPRTDARLQISYTQPVAGKITFFMLMPLVESLRQLVIASRPLLPSDVKLHNEASSADDETVMLERARITVAQASLTALRADVESYQVALQALLDDLTTHRGDILTGIQTLSDDMIALLERACRAAVPQSGLVYANDWFLLPYTLPAGTIAKIRGMAVTNVFNERTWVEAAGRGADDNWQRWSLFTLNVEGQNNEPADTSMLLLPTVPKIQEGRPLEQVSLIRDEMANMVWGIEKVVPLPTGWSKSGAEAAGETLAFYAARLAADLAATPPPPPEAAAPIRYQVMNSVPENWIPFIPVHIENDNREIQLQRAALPRLLEGDPSPPIKVRPRGVLLRHGLDMTPAQAYFLHEEEVLRAGVQVQQVFKRTRWHGGRVVTWLAVSKQTGRGEGSSGLAFDQILPTGVQPSPTG